MSDDKAYLDAVTETLERLQIEPKDLFGYVFWLRERYSSCVYALYNIYEFSDDDAATKLARETLIECGAMEDEDVSHETN